MKVRLQLHRSHFFWTWCNWGQICNMLMDQRVDMYSSKDPQWVHPKWIQARSDGDSLEIHFNVGEFQAPKRRSNFDQPELNSPKKRIDIDPKTAIAKQFMLGNEKANGDQVELDG